MSVFNSCYVSEIDVSFIFDFHLADIRELIQIDDAMEDEDLHFGPNGGLVFCME